MQRASNALRKNSFSIRIVMIWNSLPEDIVSAPSVNAFKNRLDNFLQNQDIYYDDYKADIDIPTPYHRS